MYRAQSRKLNVYVNQTTIHCVLQWFGVQGGVCHGIIDHQCKLCLMAAASVAVLECGISCIESVIRIQVMVGTGMWKRINHLCGVSK